MESPFVPSKNHFAANEEPPKSYREFISTLPRTKGWNAEDDLYHYQGFWFHPTFLDGIMSAQDYFKAQPSDILICSTPRSGTTWLKALAFAIVTRNSFDDSTSPLLSKVPHECVPFVEMDLSHGSSARDPEMPLLSTHIPFSSLPKSVLESGCRIVYICRDSKDAFVSMFHFARRLQIQRNLEPLSLEEVFELFCEGKCNYGPQWDHVLGYWRASLERPEKILFLKYEEVKEDTAVYVKKLAEFIGCPFSPEEEETGAVEKIVKMCSFENLSNLEVNKTGKHREDTPISIQNNVFFWKGKIGEWENHLTPEMAARLDRITEQKLGNSGLNLVRH
ncbi:hypothetical protein SLE2022_365250 [Rubroshorea leprosula]